MSAMQMAVTGLYAKRGTPQSCQRDSMGEQRKLGRNPSTSRADSPRSTRPLRRPGCQPILSPEAAIAQARLLQHRTSTGQHCHPCRGRCHRGLVGLRIKRPLHSGALSTGTAEQRSRPALLNQTTQHWHTGSARKHTGPMYAGRDVYESHVD
jgi:hypothetical protein